MPNNFHKTTTDLTANLTKNLVQVLVIEQAQKSVTRLNRFIST